jgi:Holliday junction resolvasome RuvABC endonuclease subunit
MILGIDPSLTGTGLAVLDTEDRLIVDTHTITSKPANLPGIDGRIQRQARICRELIDHVGEGFDWDLVVIEAPAYDSRTGHQHDRSGLWWRIVGHALDHQANVVEVTTGGLKKYATGKGNAPKDAVLLEVARRFPHVDVTNNNEADALILAAMGADWAGTPIVDLPKTHRDALAKVEWPTLEQVA